MCCKSWDSYCKMFKVIIGVKMILSPKKMGIFFKVIASILIISCMPSEIIQKKPNIEFTNSIGMEFKYMEFKYVEPGFFTMENLYDNQDAAKNQIRVHIKKGFYMQKMEVTQYQWIKLMKDNPSNFLNCSSCPVENVSWLEVHNFIKKLNKKEHTGKYRLPKEIEWEYVCKAGKNSPYNTGKCLSTDDANYNGFLPTDECNEGHNLERTTVVGSYPPNAWGFFDFHGNVWELVSRKFFRDIA
jgi:formylglycine-generating enzyme required for sulfatase activity